MDRWVAARARSPHSARAYKRVVGRFLAKLAVPLEDGNPDHAADALAAACEGLAESSAVTSMAYVKSFLSFAYKRGWTEENLGEEMKPATSVGDRRAQIAKRIVGQGAVRAILEHASCRRDRLLLGVLYAAGLRVSEVVRLKWSDVMLRDGRVQLNITGKGRRKRLVGLEPITAAALLKYRGETFDLEAPVFPSREGKGRGGHMAERTVHTMVKRTARRAGVELATTETGRVTSRVSPHWMRHCHASHALARGQTVAMVRDTLGHASVSTTDNYLHVNSVASSGDGLDESVLRAIDGD
jgi:integrase/recombinase XerD